MKVIRIEVDLHGYYAEQAETVLEQEIQRAYSCGVTELVVIHGKGTGVLREVCFNTLYAHKDKWIEIIKGEDTKEIGDCGFLKVRMRFKEISVKRYHSQSKYKKEEKKEQSYGNTLREKKEKGKQRYLKMIKRMKNRK